MLGDPLATLRVTPGRTPVAAGGDGLPDPGSVPAYSLQLISYHTRVPTSF